MPNDEAIKLDNYRKGLRRKSLSELLNLKFNTDNKATLELIQMELERRKFVQDILIDRCTAWLALIISVIALISKLRGCQSQQQVTATPSTHITAPSNSPANIPQYPNTNTTHSTTP